MAPNCPIGSTCTGGQFCCGQWSTVCEVPDGLETIHAALVHTSSTTKVLVWGYNSTEAVYADAKLWNPISDCGSFDPGWITWPSHTDPTFPGDPLCMGTIIDYAPMCGGHDYTEDGRLLIVSGNDNENGLRARTSFHAIRFDPATAAFSWAPNLIQS